MKDILFAIMILLCISCGMKVNFTPFEMSWLNVYSVGDTLIFQSETGELDTSIITGKRVYHPSYDPITKHDRHVPVFGKISYFNSRLIHNEGKGDLVSLIKYHPDSAARLFIDYRYSLVTVLRVSESTTALKNLKEGKVYKFGTDHPKSDPDKPQFLYWHEDYGLIKYITYDGITWKRIDLSTTHDY